MFKSALSLVLCVCLMLPSQALAQEPAATETFKLPEFSYSLLKKGQTLKAAKDTYLLTPETFARIVTEYEFVQKRYRLELRESISYTKLETELRTTVLMEQNRYLEAELERTNNLLIQVQKNKNTDLQPLWVALSFAAGCALTVGLVYALEPGVR